MLAHVTGLACICPVAESQTGKVNTTCALRQAVHAQRTQGDGSPKCAAT